MSARRATRRLMVAFVAAFTTIGVGVAQAAISVSPAIPLADLSATYSTNAPESAACGTIAVTSCTWDFGIGETPGSDASAPHTYATGGTKQVTFTITYLDPLTLPFSETRPVDINASRPANPTISGPTLVQSGSAATFTASSEPGSSFTWRIDGGPALSDHDSSIDATLAPGVLPHTITASATDNQGAASLGSGQITVAVNRPPVASFTFSPLGPIAGQTVGFTSTSSDPDGDPLTATWDLDGNGTFGDATGATASYVFATSGSKTVRLIVADNRGGSSAPAFNSVDVAPKQTTSGPKLLSPFPRIRYAGTLTARGVKITLFFVRAPKGARIKATCAKRCPAKAFSTTVRKTGDMRMRKLRGTYRPGAVLRIAITKKNQIGKYTLIKIPKGGAPRRSDKCLYPSSKKPRKCP
jgi:PKD repeat protein